MLRLRGDYLAIVTLAFGEIIKDLINCLLVGWDENGLHIALNVDGTKSMSSLGSAKTASKSSRAPRRHGHAASPPLLWALHW